MHWATAQLEQDLQGIAAERSLALLVRVERLLQAKAVFVCRSPELLLAGGEGMTLQCLVHGALGTLPSRIARALTLLLVTPVG